MAKRTALCGILAALSLLFLGIACVLPSGRLGFAAVAGIFPACAVMAGGLPFGFFCWAAAGVLGVLLLPDKWTAVLYLIALGLYPVVKSAIERLRKLPAEWLLKLLFFNGVLTVLWVPFRSFFLPGLPEFVHVGWVLYVVGNVIFVIYDIGLSRLLTTLFRHLRKGLRK